MQRTAGNHGQNLLREGSRTLRGVTRLRNKLNIEVCLISIDEI